MTKQFKSDSGLIFPAVTAEQVGEIDRIAMEETGPNLYQMMENAGRNLAVHSIEFLSRMRASAPVLVLAGAGGNGGGGICAARHLINHGVESVVCLAGMPRSGTVPFFQLEIFQQSGGQIVGAESLSALKPGLILDALVGYRLQNEPRGLAARLIDWVAGQSVPVISLDVPSGINATTGNAPGVYIRPVQTLTLALPKTGLTAEACGHLYLADIGIPAKIYGKIGIGNVPSFGPEYILPIHPVL